MTSIGRYLRNANRWLIDTPERALDQAYDAALMIKAIEDQHFNGEKIGRQSGNHSDNVLAYFQADLNKYLKLAEVRLTEFRASRFVVDTTNSTLYNRAPAIAISEREKAFAILEKLQFIDGVLNRYKSQSVTSKALVPISQVEPTQALTIPENSAPNGNKQNIYVAEASFNAEDSSVLDKTGVLPRSIIGTLNRIKRDLDPKSEEEMVRTFRNSKAKTLISMRLILLLIIIPLLTQQISKTFFVGPIVEHIWKPEKTEIFLNFELEEEALREFNLFKERLEFDQLLDVAPKLSENQNLETQAASFDEIIKEKAKEIATNYSKLSQNSIKNVFADFLSLISFAVVLLVKRQDLETLKLFIDETVYGLSDSAKAFIIILFTDIFVGFHSPHGWEVLLEGLAKHFGLPANRDFIFLFIATFPVILDTIFKYWIFRYLNRISPSAVATYKNMNET
jgi:hypothetical protein